MIANRTDEEINQLAIDILAGLVFTSSSIRDAEELMSVFLCLGMMERDELKKLAEDEPAFFYEYLSKAGPLSVNGMPRFFSVNMLNHHDMLKLREKHDELKAVAAA